MIRVAEIGLDEEYAATERAQALGGFFRLCSRPSVHKGDVSAGAGQFGGHNRPDSPATGYQRNAPDELHSATSLVEPCGSIRKRFPGP